MSKEVHQRLSLAEQKSPTLSRRNFLKGAAALGATALLGASKLDSRPVQADAASETQEYMSSMFNLKELATQDGLELGFGVAGEDTIYPQYKIPLKEEANSLSIGQDLIWYRDPNWYKDKVRPELNFQSAEGQYSWDSFDHSISFAKSFDERLDIPFMIFDDMGTGQSTSGVQRSPDWYMNGGFDYEHSMKIETDTTKAIVDHLTEKGIIVPGDTKSNSKNVSLGLFNEIFNNNIDAQGNLQIDLGDPKTYLKRSSYIVNKALEEGDPFENGIPRFVVDNIKQLIPIGSEIGISDYGGETKTDFTDNTVNQKAEAMFRFFMNLKKVPELEEAIKQRLLYVGLQGHFNKDLVQKAGVDKFAQDVAQNAERYIKNGFNVKFSEITIDGNDENFQADFYNALTYYGTKVGVKDYTIFDLSDSYNPDLKQSILDETQSKKLSYAGYAAGLSGKRIHF
jgi:hypothetical protein